jgi:acetyl esterase/lipase
MDQRDSNWAIVSVSYRSPPVHGAPDPIRDIKRAILWLRTNAAPDRVNAQHIVIAGSSGGAHLAAMVGLTDQEEDKETFHPRELSGVGNHGTNVQGMIVWQGPDLKLLANNHLINASVACHGNQYLNCLLDGVPTPPYAPPFFACNEPLSSATCNPDQLKLAAPIDYVTSRDAPIYLAYGKHDTLVTKLTGEELRAKYRDVGLGQKVWFDEVDNASHCFEYHGINRPSLECFLERTRNEEAECECTDAPIDFCPTP